MNQVWLFSTRFVPALLGALVTRGVVWYASATAPAAVIPSQAPSAEPGLHHFEVLSAEPVVTESTTPVDGLSERSFGEASAVRHGERVYLAVESHELGESARQVRILSSRDEVEWRQEYAFPNTDAGNPKLLELGADLFVYTTSHHFGEVGENQATRLDANGIWHDPVSLNLGGQELSQVKVVDGVPLMTTYTAAEGIYRFESNEREVRILTSKDGIDWHAPSAGKWAVYKGGGSDASFTSNDDGSLLAVVRKEAGDSQGWGSSVCMAAASNWTDWDCVNDTRNYGAAAMFSYDGETYLVGQRKVGDDPNYDLGHSVGFLRTLQNQFSELSAGRRCALYRYVATEKRIAYVGDLPSRGDTCNPAVIPGSQPGQFVVYTPTSALDGPDQPVVRAHEASNRLYRYVISLSRERTTSTVGY
ncbi:MAG TPA: hypothetical protein VHM70_07735 [Polyangiaceae bacterium]|nr:hypothetical protein [Polyangiaceae bacterium]